MRKYFFLQYLISTANIMFFETFIFYSTPMESTKTQWYPCVIRNVTQRKFIPHANGTVAWEFVSNKRVVAEGGEREIGEKRDTMRKRRRLSDRGCEWREGEKERVGEKAVDEI